jgi:hypothetical protein
MRWLNEEQTRKKQATSPEISRRGLAKGEWIILFAIFLISGLVAFAYVRNQLSESERYQGNDVTYVTPVPTPESARSP